MMHSKDEFTLYRAKGGLFNFVNLGFVVLKCENEDNLPKYWNWRPFIFFIDNIFGCNCPEMCFFFNHKIVLIPLKFNSTYASGNTCSKDSCIHMQFNFFAVDLLEATRLGCVKLCIGCPLVFPI